MKTHIFNREKAFTLIELLVVMAVIGTLATVLVIVINPAEYFRRTNDAKRISDVSMVKSAIDLARADGMPIPDTGGYINLNESVPLTTIDTSGKLDKYISSFPSDPSSNTSGNVKALVFSGSDCVMGEINGSLMEYQFLGDATNNTYEIRTHLQSVTNCPDVTADDTNAYYIVSDHP